jgi:hypothetical protein
MYMELFQTCTGIIKLPYPLQTEVNFLLRNHAMEVKHYILLMSPIMVASSLLHTLVTLPLVSTSMHLVGMKQLSDVQPISLMTELCGNHETYFVNLKIPLLYCHFTAFTA